MKVTEKLSTDYGIAVQPGKKTTCPFCNENKFSIKADDTLAKCFHPACGRFITAHGFGTGPNRSIQKVLESVYQGWHEALLSDERSETYRYLEEERKIHPQVIADSMLGVVPPGCDLGTYFSELLDKEEESRGEAHERSISVNEIYQKIQRCTLGASGWLCFFYTDAYHNIVAIKFRKPFSKDIRYFKPFENAGLFGRELFSATRSKDLPENLIVVEGEFNQLQLQSLVLRRGEPSDQIIPYVNACAVGGVNNADIECLKAVSKTPTICFDNDVSGAGFVLVDMAREHMGVNAFTTPGENSDLDSYIRSFGDDYEAAWNGIKELIGDRKQHARYYSAVAETINDIRRRQRGKNGLMIHEVSQEVTRIICDDLQARGCLYHCADDAYFFDESEKSLIPIERDSIGLELLMHKYRLNQTEKLHAYVVRELRLEAINKGIQTNVHKLAYFDTATWTHYLNNHNNQVVRITSSDIDIVDNGTDGILFLSDPGWEPWKLVRYDPSLSLLNEIIIAPINFLETHVPGDEQRVVFWLWLMSILFPNIMPTKPIMALIGDQGSGKSMALKATGMLLQGGNFNVTPMPNKPEDFDVAVTTTPYVVLDNADSKCNWLLDRMAIVATGSSLKRRKLYTDNTLIDKKVCCNLAITSHSPKYNRPDVAQRLLIQRLQPIDPSRFVPERQLLDRVLNNRDLIMTEIVYQIQDIVKALREHDGSTNSFGFRMADFGAFSYKIATWAGVGPQVARIFLNLREEQSAFSTEDDPLMVLLDEWVPQYDGREVDAATLCSELNVIAQKHDIDWWCKGKPGLLGRRISAVKQSLMEYWDLRIRVGGARKKYYTFSQKKGEQVNE